MRLIVLLITLLLSQSAFAQEIPFGGPAIPLIWPKRPPVVSPPPSYPPIQNPGIGITFPQIHVPQIGGNIGGNLICTAPVTQISIDYATAAGCIGRVCAAGAGVNVTCTMNNHTGNIDCLFTAVAGAGIPGVGGISIEIRPGQAANITVDCNGVIRVLNAIKNNKAIYAPVYNY